MALTGVDTRSDSKAAVLWTQVITPVCCAVLCAVVVVQTMWVLDRVPPVHHVTLLPSPTAAACTTAGNVTVCNAKSAATFRLQCVSGGTGDVPSSPCRVQWSVVLVQANADNSACNAGSASTATTTSAPSNGTNSSSAAVVWSDANAVDGSAPPQPPTLVAPPNR